MSLSQLEEVLQAYIVIVVLFISYIIPMLKGLLQQTQAEDSRDQIRRRRSGRYLGASARGRADNKRLVVRNTHKKENIAPVATYDRGELQDAYSKAASSDESINLALPPAPRSNHKKRPHQEEPPAYRRTSIVSHETYQKSSQPYEPYDVNQRVNVSSHSRSASDDPLFFSQQSWDAIHTAAQNHSNTSHPHQETSAPHASRPRPQQYRPYDSNALLAPANPNAATIRQNDTHIPSLGVQQGLYLHGPREDRTTEYHTLAPSQYHQSQAYVPTNPTVLPIASYLYPRAGAAIDSTQAQYHRRPRDPRRVLHNQAGSFMHSSSFIIPIGHSRPVFDIATRAKLKRRLAITILAEKLHATLEKRKNEGLIAYEPEVPAYEHDIHASRPAYDPSNPKY